MISNILQVEMEAKKIALKNQKGAIILFDFAAAFPWVSHDLIHSTLERLRVPLQVRNLVAALYDNIVCHVNTNDRLNYPRARRDSTQKKG